MVDTLQFINDKFRLEYDKKTKLPIQIPDFGRDQLAVLFKELGFKIGVEIGVQKGEYSKILLDANPDGRLYGVDPFIPYKWYRDFTRRETISAYQKEAHDRLDGYLNYTFLEETSMEAVERFQDNTLDFVYIDGNHEFSFVASDISFWLKKVRPGGIISGHDYIRRPMPTQTHVHQVVNAYTQAYEISPWFVLGHEANDEGLIRDKERSWMWVKA